MTNATSSLANSPPKEDPLRFTFVEMLFALAVSQVAMGAADLASLTNPIAEKTPALSHLALSLLVIATSWVGWRRSQSPGTKHLITSIFEIRFVHLMLDVLLVILYFILVKTTEIEQVNGNPRLIAPNATPESLWISAIFAVYTFWDLLADVFSAGCVPQLPFFSRLWKGFRIAIVSTFCSALCLGLSWSVYKYSINASSASRVVALDIALLAVIFLFRILKTIENPLSRWFGVADCNAFSPPRPAQGNDRLIASVLLTIYGIALCLGAFSSTICAFFQR